MADRPILFSAPMVQALLAGRKTQTRRLIKDDVRDPPGMDAVHPKNTIKHPAPYLDSYCSGPRSTLNPRGMSDRWCWWTRDDRQCLPTFRAPFVPGDRLWVKETWAAGSIYDGMPPRDINPGGKPGWCGIRYAATDERNGIKDRPSLFMPRWASRLTLLVTEVRVERLQDISEADAIAEGALTVDLSTHGAPTEQGRPPLGQPPSQRFRHLWNGINGPDAWAANPWVVAVTFEVHQRNIDQLAPADALDIAGAA